MCPKSFVIIFITYVFYTRDIPTMGSHRDNMCFVCLFFFMMDYGENDYLHSKMCAKMTEN